MADRDRGGGTQTGECKLHGRDGDAGDAGRKRPPQPLGKREEN